MILLNNTKLKFTQFPNGETLADNKLLKKSIKPFGNYMELKYENDLDLIYLMFIKKHLDEYGNTIDNVTLIIKYMPYSRMDRSENSSLFTLKYIADFINNLNFSKVVIWESHSDVAIALLNNCININKSVDIAKKIILDSNFNINNDYIYFPDTTALKRYGNHFNGYNHLTGLKDRDFETGFIKSLTLLGDIKSDNFKVIMIDDLCSRGGTFLLGADKLKEKGAQEIYLAVTHCENSIYDGSMFKSDLINKVYATDSILSNFSEKEKLIIL